VPARFDAGELAQGHAGAVPAVDQEGRESGESTPPTVREPHDEIEPALSHPDLRDLFPGETDAECIDHIRRGEPHALHGFAVDRSGPAAGR